MRRIPPHYGEKPPVPPRRPTMKDVARESGVSVSAASFALNNRPGVSDSTRRRVIRVAERLGWRPNTAARALSNEHSGAVGLALARSAAEFGLESFYLRLVSGIQTTISPLGLALVFQMVDDLAAECGLYRDWWAEGRVDGVLVIDPRVNDPRPAALAVLGLPAVIIGGIEAPGTPDAPRLPPHTRLSNIWTDDAGAMDLIVRHLHTLGHRRIAYLAGPHGLAHTARRVAALKATGRQLDLECIPPVSPRNVERHAARVARRLLSADPAPTALICDNEVLAVAALSAAADERLRVPDDLSVVSCEDSAVGRALNPPLTTLAREADVLGKQAADELLSLIGGAAPRQTEDPRPTLCTRASTAPPPTEGIDHP